MFQRNHTRTVQINGRDLEVVWTSAAQRALTLRTGDLYVELELYFSCLVKKFLHFRDQPRGQLQAVRAADRLCVYFRPVTSTACSPDEAEKLGRQPETEIEMPQATRLAPKKVRIDYRDGAWCGAFSM